MSKKVQDGAKRTRGKNKPKLQDKPETLANYAIQRARGFTKSESARQLGLSRRALQHLEKANHGRLEELISIAGDTMAREGLLPAIDLMINTINESREQSVQGIRQTIENQINEKTGETTEKQVDIYDHNLHKSQIGLRKVATTAAEDIMKAAGIIPTQTAAPVIQSLTVNQQNILLPVTVEVLKNVALDVIEGEIVED